MTNAKPTIDDVAALAKVGRTTVSRVLNNGPNVRAEVRHKVQAAVAMLGYTVNVQARSLAGGSSRQIALIQASDLDREPNSFYHSGLELGALRACSELGFRLVTHAANPNSTSLKQRLSDLIGNGRYSAIILTPPISDLVELVEHLHGKGCPVVCISAGVSVQQFASTVGIDDRRAAFEVTQHLIDLGHRRFGFIRGLDGHISAEQRYEGFHDAILAAGIDVSDVVIERGDYTFHSGIECARLIFDRPNMPTALICTNDDMAAGALLTMHKMGLDIPGSISVTGFDDTPVSEIVWPPLTTIHQPIKDIGHRAIQMAAAAISAPLGTRTFEHDIVAFHIVKRESTDVVAFDG